MSGKLQKLGASLISKTNLLLQKTVEASSLITNKTLYYGKVTGELSKQIYHKEGLQPPSLEEFKGFYSKLYENSFQYLRQPNTYINSLQKISKNDAWKYGAYAVQLIGFYSVGEMIGRRKLVGYRNYSV
ncbi:hypothetical protein KAFR_0C03100 [Kazachstania africana CBS 2517]|uniref:Uncharacterized protein n=1 Tax=Kazachstania africana (strain ATCC 22294 / BCRC 22015 / CBS 2517 / CECT 1963 / NBRC 1671 / NRRL Y-8276) TaxID=1071382 RepID=H2ASF2_KAZAF|nr:hypothetical protein KAFR_0C03100 [Kazachstania africana CBS 2517]CCF57302.1 hypothetical protein KAFR_0C03100 [Kazachstania africana CBS 2517]